MVAIKVFDPVPIPVSILTELSDLRFRVDQLRDENQQLHRHIEQLQRDLDQAHTQLDQARAELDQTRRLAKRQAAPFSKGSPQANPKRPGRKSGAAHGRHGHRLPPTPATVDLVIDVPLPEACPRCGGSLHELHITQQYQTDIPRRPLVRQFDIHVGLCHGCGRRIHGRHPLQTSDALGAAATQLGPDAQAAVVFLNKSLGLSHLKVSTVFDKLFGIPVTRGASAQIVLRAARRLEPTAQAIGQELKAARYLTPDETGWRVAGLPAWLHAWVSPRAVVYAIDKNRSADVLERQIGRTWSGTMTHDGFSSYDRFRRATHQQCLGHLIRRVRDLAARATRGAVHYPRKLLELLTGALHLRNRYLTGEVSAEALQQARQEFEARLERLAKPAREVPAYETLSEHIWKHLDEWFSFLSDGEVEPTNWEGEQAIRPAVVNRKVWGGNRTWPGAHAQEVLMSVLGTSARRGGNGLEFVSEMLRAFGNPTLPRPVLIEPR